MGEVDAMKRSRNKYKPHQGAQEIARRAKNGRHLLWVNASMKLKWFPSVTPLPKEKERE